VFWISDIYSVETYGNQLYFCELVPKDESEWDLSFLEESQTSERSMIDEYYREKEKTSVGFEGEPRTIKLGDTVYVSIICYDEDGTFINMGTSPKGVINRSLYVGGGYYFDNIDLKIIGHSIGDELTVTCVIPDQYVDNPQIAGKTITSLIRIIGIKSEIE